MGNVVLKVDQEFKELVPPMSAEEYRQLRDNIVRDGCRDSIVVWDGIILDGYTRYRICEEENIPFTTVEVRVADREEAKRWIIMNQIGKRNLRSGQISMLRGILFNKVKSKRGGARKKNESGKEKLKEIVDQSGVSEKTLRRDGKFVDTVEKISTVVPDIKEKIISGEINKTTILEASKVIDDDIEKAKAIINNEREDKTGYDKIEKSLVCALDMLNKVIVKDIIDTLNDDEKMEINKLLDIFVMKLEKMKDLFEVKQ